MIDSQLFREISIFSTLSEEELHALAQVAELKDYPSGSTLVEPNEVSQKLFFIQSGKVRELIRKVPGWPPIVRTLKEGDLLGGACLFERICPSQEIIALTDTKVIEMDKNDFLKVIRGHTELLLDIVEESSLVQPLGDERHFDWIQGDVAHFEKWISSELESNKLRYEALEKQAAATIEMMEKQAQENTEQAEKQIELAISESKSELEKNQEQVNQAITKLDNSTSAALQKVNTFWKWVTWILPILGITGGITYGTFIHFLNEVRNASQEAKTYAKESKKNATDITQIKEQLGKDEKKITSQTRSLLNKYKALESSANAIHSEIDVISPWRSIRLPDEIREKYKQDDLKTIKYLNLNMNINRIKLLEYLKDYYEGDVSNQPESLVNAINTFLRLSLESKQKINPNSPNYGDERNLVWNCCLRSLDEFEEKYNKEDQSPDWRFNAKAEDNIVIFGNLMKDFDRKYYENTVIPDLIKYVKNTTLQIYARQAVAEALAMLWVENKEAQKEAQQVLKQISHKNRSIWAQIQAEACLLRLGDPEAYSFLDNLMNSRYGKEGFIAALSAGEVLLEKESKKRVNLKRLNPKTVIEVLNNKLTKEIDAEDINIFRRLYAEEIQKELQKKYGLKKPS